MSSFDNICGVVKTEDEFKNIVLSDQPFDNPNVKEIIWSTTFGDVEALFGFEDLNIVEIDQEDTMVHNARVFLSSNDLAQGVVFLSNGYLVITDLMFPSAYTRIDGKDTPYTSLVESDTYEDEVAANLIECDIRLQ